MEIIKITIFILLQISLIVLAQNITSPTSEKQQKAKISSREINDTVESISSNIVNSKTKENENSTMMILNLDSSNVTESELNSTKIIPTTTPLIPVANVDAQIEKIDVTTKKPSRVQIVAAQ